MVAYLNAQQREQLAKELVETPFKKAQRKLRRMNDEARLAFYRNQQSPTHVMTRYVLPNLGAVVTLIETHSSHEEDGKIKADYELEEVIVEPTADNT